ncbi:MAG: tRNA pseudouridine(13) synthase TruD [Pseudomonadales bacterium]|nr:tRNA pseudouridine(13) synthase TruD [Pseudomonadales bacterium]
MNDSVGTSKPSFALNWPYAYGIPEASGIIRSTNSDFQVEEILGWQPEGVGEHVYLLVEKDGQNTQFIARRIGNYAQVRTMDVGFSGMKDRHAVTRQWFSIYLKNSSDPAVENWDLPGAKILDVSRHSKKLRRGQHIANRFQLVIRQFSGDSALLENRLSAIRDRGVPNYFGEQRFGRDLHNLNVAHEWFSGERKIRVKDGGMYLSAARSYLFNQLLAHRVTQQSWQAPIPGDAEINGGLAGSLFGEKNCLETLDAEANRNRVIEAWPVFSEGLVRNRIQNAYREFVLQPTDMSWALDGDTLSITFVLPTGSFATAVLREVLNYQEFEVKPAV